MSGDHAVLAPSFAPVWSKCSGAVQMAILYPDTEDSEPAMWGTAAHELAGKMIHAHARGHIGYPERPTVVGTFASNGVLIDDEMFDAAEVYADDVATVMIETGVFGGPHWANEQKLEIPRIHDLNAGTPDQWLFHQAGAKLYVWDAKFGFEIVEPFENMQTIDYVAGIIGQLGIDGIADQYIDVHIRIAQPRAYHRDGPIREWVVKASELRAYFNILESQADEALGIDAKTVPGSHCKYCPGRHACQSAQRYAMAGVDFIGRPMPEELDAEAVGIELANLMRAEKAIEYRKTGLEAQAYALITRSGQRVPNFAVEETYGREAWTKPVDDIALLGDLLGVDLRKQDVVTPNQARKLGIDATVIKDYCGFPNRGLKLVFDDGATLRRVFSKLKGSNHE